MPPKSASTTRPQRRSDQTAGRRPIPGPNSAAPSNSRPPSSTSALTTGVIRPPSAAISTSNEAFQETRSLITSNTEKALQEPLHAKTPASRPPQPRNSGKTLASNSGFSKSDMGSFGGNKNKESGKSFDPVQPDTLISVQAVTNGDGKENAVGSSSLPPHVPDDGSVKPVEPESVASGAALPGKGKRTIVRKTVRIVKKIVKRRVPKKRALMDGSENQESVAKDENRVDSSEVTQNSNLANDVIEKSNLVDDVIDTNRSADEGKELLAGVDDVAKKLHLSTDVIEKSNVVEGVNEESSIIDEAMQKSERVNNASISEPFIGEEVNGTRGIYCMETEPSKLDFGARVPEQVVLANDQRECMNSNDVITEVDSNDLNVCVHDPVELENVNSATRPNMEINEMTNTATEHHLSDSFTENENLDIVNKVDVGPVGEKSVVSDGEKSESIRLNEGLLLSGEMEALERKKRRKTEIFVGGLDNDAKESDVRKGFEEAGGIAEVRLVMDGKSGKNRGYAFVQFATAADAKNALAKCSKVEICGKVCNAAPVGGNDTIFLGNIDRNWKSEDVVKLLEKAGIKRIDKVTVKDDPKNTGKNRGFAFLELETCKDAQTAYMKLQKKDVFGNVMVRVAWAQPLSEPADEEILKVKSVYAEYLPYSWDGEKVKEYFGRFGDIVNVVLAKDLHYSRRKDFAFINYTTRDAALACIEAVSRERLEDGCSKVKIAVSLARPVQGTNAKHTSHLPVKQLSYSAQKAETSVNPHEPRNKGTLGSSSYGQMKVDNRASTNDELVHLLRQQSSTKRTPPPHSRWPHASTENIVPYPRTGVDAPDYRFPSPGSGKRPFSLVAHDPMYAVPQGLPRMRMESSYPNSGPSSSFHGVGALSFPYHQHQHHHHHQQPGPGPTSESVNGRRTYTSHYETREQAPYYGDYNRYPRY
ncbi:hypothetical protein ABFS82_12G159500 [Erythranthe guttata]|uniref:nucleolin 2-like n=1 Tax=Erythranthe guttata TaxID=4155 RepID=UPI00064DC4BD|nr:PREDICTED: nucleolin 2-like [Erythranthe guttata]|eukprot:XP_012836202.1 PREDICTED: nucleolin 2-like [Erythranthe guttata]